jgi:hypothetical protein
MTAWEYGYIYVVHTVGPAPAVCIVIDKSEPRVLDGCHGVLRAANQLGANGWIVSGNGEKLACPVWVNDIVSKIEEAYKGDHMVSYFMRRAVGRAEPLELLD